MFRQRTTEGSPASCPSTVCKSLASLCNLFSIGIEVISCSSASAIVAEWIEAGAVDSIILPMGSYLVLAIEAALIDTSTCLPRMPGVDEGMMYKTDSAYLARDRTRRTAHVQLVILCLLWTHNDKSQSGESKCQAQAHWSAS